MVLFDASVVKLAIFGSEIDVESTVQTCKCKERGSECLGHSMVGDSMGANPSGIVRFDIHWLSWRWISSRLIMHLCQGDE